MSEAHSNVIEVTHPVVTHKLDLLRDTKTGSGTFRDIVRELSGILAYEALRDLPLTSEEMTIWSGKYSRQKISSKTIAFVPIVRAGLAMLDGSLGVFPKAATCFIGINRNEQDASPHFYYKNIIGDISSRTAVIIDPMLATGGSILFTVDLLKNCGCQNIKIVTILSAPEGIQAIHAKYPSIPIYTGHIDEKLDEKFFILPGLGDAGDRCFNTVP